MKRFFKDTLDFLLNIGYISTDSKELSIKKSSLIIVPLIIGPAAFIWGLIYISLGQVLSGFIPLSYAFISILNLIHLYYTKDVNPFFVIQLTLVLLLPFLLMWSLGGFATGSYVMIWAFYAPIIAMIYKANSNARKLFYLFLSLLLVSTLIDRWLTSMNLNVMPQIAIELFFLLNAVAGLGGIYFLFKYFIEENNKNASSTLKKEHDALLKTTKELEEVNKKLEKFARNDSLTGISNRYHFNEVLSKMTAYAKRTNIGVALLYIDLDAFKSVNDNCGHNIGDEVLQLVSSRMKDCLREEDMLSRIGGDEFAVVMYVNNNFDYIKEIAQRLIDEINKDFDCIDYPSPLGASIGISLFPMHTSDVDVLMTYADKAMYDIKKKTKNGYAIYTDKS